MNTDILHRMNTPRLLAYYKSERERNRSFYIDYMWEICDEEDFWEVYKDRRPYLAKRKQEYDDRCRLIAEMKKILDTREHVPVRKKRGLNATLQRHR